LGRAGRVVASRVRIIPARAAVDESVDVSGVGGLVEEEREVRALPLAPTRRPHLQLRHERDEGQHQRRHDAPTPTPLLLMLDPLQRTLL
jgi:hypothetical protein